MECVEARTRSGINSVECTLEDIAQVASVTAAKVEGLEGEQQRRFSESGPCKTVTQDKNATTATDTETTATWQADTATAAKTGTTASRRSNTAATATTARWTQQPLAQETETALQSTTTRKTNTATTATTARWTQHPLFILAHYPQQADDTDFRPEEESQQILTFTQDMWRSRLSKTDKMMHRSEFAMMLQAHQQEVQANW